MSSIKVIETLTNTPIETSIIVSMNASGLFHHPVRVAQEPLGLFLRPGSADHNLASQLLSEGYTQISGVVFDPTCAAVQEKLRDDVLARRFWAVMDSKAMELASPGGFTGKRASLPWAGETIHTPDSLSGLGGRNFLEKLVGYIGENGFNAVLAPTHFLDHGGDDPWFFVDRQLVIGLRSRLDAVGLDAVAIYYPLATTARVFARDETRAKIKSGLTGLPINSVWLRIEGFGSGSTASAIQKYIRACQDLHGLKNVAIIPDKAGAAGACLLAFGAASGVECGVSSGEAFRFANLRTPPEPGRKGFAAHRHVYLSKIGAFLSPKEARIFFANRTMRANFACTDSRCCRRGADDMVENPRRHFVISRMLEVDNMSRVPANLRPQIYLDEFLRPATDQASRAFRADLPEDLRDKIEGTRKRLDGWRATLGEMAHLGPPQTFAPALERRIQRVGIGA